MLFRSINAGEIVPRGTVITVDVHYSSVQDSTEIIDNDAVSGG